MESGLDETGISPYTYKSMIDYATTVTMKVAPSPQLQKNNLRNIKKVISMTTPICVWCVEKAFIIGQDLNVAHCKCKSTQLMFIFD